MRATRLLLATEIGIFVIFFVAAFAGESLDIRSSALGTFQFLGGVASCYLLSKARPSMASPLDWLVCSSVVLVASNGFAGLSITLLALYLFVKGREDLNMRASGTIAVAMTVQAVWAPLVFAKLSFLFLQIDAGVVGSLLSLLLPGASWSGTVVYTPSGHNVDIYAPCASFHNISLASLCWVTLTMLRRPYWVKGDLCIGLLAAAVQFGFNIWRLVFVCLSLPMYEFWHDGFGKHIFSAVATACAIVFVQTALVRRDRRNSPPAMIGDQRCRHLADGPTSDIRLNEAAN